MIKVVTVVGARPQFIKAAAVSQVFNNFLDTEEILLHTGQHFDHAMSKIFFQELQIPKAKYNLNIHSDRHGAMTGKMLEAIEAVLLNEKPHALLAYGDTNSTLAGALAAAKLNIPICHVEAGLRSFNRIMPEETNRVVTDHLSKLLFCPTHVSIENLKNEGMAQGVHYVGDVMYDMFLKVSPIANLYSKILEELSLDEKKYALATIHRSENTDSPESLRKIITYIGEQSKNQNLKIVLPLHPRTKKLSQDYKIDFESIITCDPLGYLDMQRLLQGAALVMTDSGGLQKEAYFNQIPCITLRTESEWLETLESGWNRLWHEENYVSPRVSVPEYGDGAAANRIVNIIRESFRS